MNKKFKLSFNKRSTVDILSTVLILAVVVLGFANYFGMNITSDQVESLIKSVGLICGIFGLSLNTSTGTGTSHQSQQVNVSSESVSDALKLGQEIANAVVPELAVNPGLTKTERKKAGIQQVLTWLTTAGKKLDAQTVAGIVERAYQLYKASGGTSLDVAETPASTEVIEPDEEASDNE